MGIFSFGKKGAGPSERGNGRPRTARSEERRDGGGDRSDLPPGTARARRTRSVGQEAMLDPTLPEKQRARRRLVGAIALVLAAVIVLPMVLDARPKPVTDNIAISIPGQAGGGSQVRRATSRDADATESAAPDSMPPTPSDGATNAGSGIATNATTGAATNATTNVGSNAGTHSTSNAGSNAATSGAGYPASNARSNAANGAAPGSGAAAGGHPASSTVAKSATVSRAAPASSAALPATPATPGSRYVIQLGSFTSDANAREWVGKLKNIGVPAYIERSRQADGQELLMLRAGPFADRQVAQAAVSKVRQAGLSQAGR